MQFFKRVFQDSIKYKDNASDQETKENTDSDYEPIIKKKKKERLVNEGLASSADRLGLTNTQLTMLLPHVSGIGEKIRKKKVSFSKSTIKRNRETCRKNTATKIRDSFKPESFLTVHWDGKHMKGFTKSEKCNRLAILVSGGGKEKILEITKCTSGQGEVEAESVFEALQKWQLTDYVKAMSFDTTASNTGPHKGACVLLEQKLEKELYYLVCRCHMHELIPTAIYEKMFAGPNGPDTQLFKRFQTAWPSLNKNNFLSGMDDEELQPFLEPIRKEMTDFCREQLKLFQPRDDYRELLELCLLVLGEKQEKVNRFNLEQL